MREMVAAACLALAGNEALAQTGTTRASDWQIGLGAAAIVAPKAIGSEKTRYLLVPTFDLRFGDWAFFDPIRGLGVQATSAAGFTASAALGVSLDSRRDRSDSRYRGLGNIAESPAAIFGLDYASGDVFVSTSLHGRLAHGRRRGTLLDADAGYNLVATRRALLSSGVTLRAMDSAYARNFLGVDASQAAASGLPAFEARAGLQRAGLFTQIVYRLSDEWTLFGRIESARLVGAAGRSPIVERRQQTTFIVSALRFF